jgi:glyoxylase-like metal-dependent hydrolase (beta-lactamase superfamily II)
MEAKTESERGTPDVARRLLNDYGTHQLRISTPLPELKVNVYFAEKPVPSLIDTPPDGAFCLNELNAALLARGHSVEKIERIIVSHPHWDHFGGTQTIREMSGAEVWVFEGASHRFENYEKQARQEKAIRIMLLEKAGATTSEMQGLLAHYEARANLGQNIFPSRRLKEDERFKFGSLTLTVTAVPGHTPWCVLFSDENKGIAFSGDFFINNSSSNPLGLMTGGRSTKYRSLVSYRASLEAVKRMNLEALLPGHGRIIQDPSKRIEDRLKAIDTRRSAILGTLKKGSQTAAQITRQIFPNLAHTRVFRGIFDVSNHLELLEEDLLVERRDGIPTYFSLVRE